VERAEELLAQGAAGPRVVGADPETGLAVLVLSGRYGPFVQLGELDTQASGKTKEKPKRASLLSDMAPDTLTLDDALALLALPRVVGELDGVEVTAQNGRYGPYLKRGTDSRSLDHERQLFTVTLPEAQAIFAQPKRRGRQARAALADLGTHPDTGAPVRVLEGRFGPYVTDGTTNASVPRGVVPEDLDLERAVDLLREREARGPAKKKATKKKAPAKKSAAKKSTARKATKKAAPRKAPRLGG
jgi:DNA topoisomerase-1